MNARVFGDHPVFTKERPAHAPSLRNAGLSPGSGWDGAAPRRAVPALPARIGRGLDGCRRPGGPEFDRAEGYPIARQPFCRQSESVRQSAALVPEHRPLVPRRRRTRPPREHSPLRLRRRARHAAHRHPLPDLCERRRPAARAALRPAGRAALVGPAALLAGAGDRRQLALDRRPGPRHASLDSAPGRSPSPRSTWAPTRSSSPPVATPARCAGASGSAMRRCC